MTHFYKFPVITHLFNASRLRIGLVELQLGQWQAIRVSEFTEMALEGEGKHSLLKFNGSA